MKKKIVCFGSFIADLTGRADHLPDPGETVMGSYFKMGPGGKGSNQAVAANRAGADVVMVTKVGNDAFGKMALNNFKIEKMDTQYILIDKEKPTGTALIIVDDNTAQNEILVVIGASGNINHNDIEKTRGIIENADILLCQLETNLDALEKVMDIAYKSGAKIILNTAPARSIPDKLLAMCTVVTPNEVEAAALTGIPIEKPEDACKAAAVFIKRGAKQVVITLGSKGCYVNDGKNEIIIPALHVKAVDTAGAGDAFNGALAAALSEGKDIFESCRFATAAAAVSVTKYGTAPSMPYRCEIDEMLANVNAKFTCC